MSYTTELQFAKQLARDAGEIMLAFFAKDDVGTTWKHDNTPLTEADTQINALVIKRVREQFPGHGVLGEEACYEENASAVWVVDPIDGTQPFDLKAPTSTFCLGLVVEGEVQLGVVYDPFTQRLFSAVKGEGAYLNETLLKVRNDAPDITHKYVVLSSKHGDDHASVGMVADAITAAGGKYFNFRSVVYGLMSAASGRAIAAIAGPSHPWDFVAASIIVVEAGLVWTDLNGNPVDVMDARKGIVVGANGAVHGLLLAMLKKKP